MEMNMFSSKEDIIESFENQRRDRLADAIGDYLTDESVDARQAYEEILAEVHGWVKYHEKFLVKAQNLYTLLQGERPVISFNK